MINLDQAIAAQKLLHEEAQSLLNEIGISDQLERLGEVRFTGSYASRLMVKPDIDMEVIAPEAKTEQILELAGFFMSIPAYDVVLADGTEYQRSVGHPKGYYLGPHVLKGSVKWQFDIWILRTSEDRANSPYISINNPLWYTKLTQVQRNSIILLKHQLSEINRYNEYGSANVYEAVIRAGVQDLEGLDAWAKTFDISQNFIRK